MPRNVWQRVVVSSSCGWTSTEPSCLQQASAGNLGAIGGLDCRFAVCRFAGFDLFTQKVF